MSLAPKHKSFRLISHSCFQLLLQPPSLRWSCWRTFYDTNTTKSMQWSEILL